MNLTKQQRKALEFLRDDKEYGDMVREDGSGWWLGTHKTNGKLALGLIRLCLVSMDGVSGYGDKYQRWIINESGLRALGGKSPYARSDGTYANNLHEISKVSE